MTPRHSKRVPFLREELSDLFDEGLVEKEQDLIKTRIERDKSEAQLVAKLLYIDGLLHESARIDKKRSRPMSIGRGGNKIIRLTLSIAATMLLALSAEWLWFNHILNQRSLMVIALEESAEYLPHEIGGTDAWKSIREGMQIRPGYAVRTLKESSLKLAYQDGSSIQLGPLSELGIDGKIISHFSSFMAKPEDKKLSLTRGVLDSNIAKQKPKYGPMTIVTPHAKVTVVGTAFQMRETDESTNLSVKHGIVDFTDLVSGETTQISAGQSIQSGAGIDRKGNRTESLLLLERGRGKFSKGEMEGAQEDLQAAEKFLDNQENKQRMIYLACLYSATENHEGAIPIYDKLIQLNCQTPYMTLGLHIAEQYLGRTSNQLGVYRDRLESNLWPAPAIDMFLNRITPDEMIRQFQKREGKEKPSPGLEGIRSSAYYYAGEYYAVHGEWVKAREYFKKSAAIKNYTIWLDPVMSRERLKQIDRKK